MRRPSRWHAAWRTISRPSRSAAGIGGSRLYLPCIARRRAYRLLLQHGAGTNPRYLRRMKSIHANPNPSLESDMTTATSRTLFAATLIAATLAAIAQPAAAQTAALPRVQVQADPDPRPRGRRQRRLERGRAVLADQRRGHAAHARRGAGRTGRRASERRAQRSQRDNYEPALTGTPKTRQQVRAETSSASPGSAGHPGE